MFLGFADPDSSIRDTDPDPDQRIGSADPDPYQYFMDPQHCWIVRSMRTHPDQDPQHRLFFLTQVDGKLPADGVGPGGGPQGRLRISLQQADQLCLHQLARHARELFSPRVYPMGHQTLNVVFTGV